MLPIKTKGVELKKASKALILLHGRGASAEDILSLASKLQKDDLYIAAPDAPNHIWYPASFMARENENEPTLSHSINSIKELIDEIALTIPYEKIYLMGFSQGACLSLEISSRFARKYGGIAAFSGGLIGQTINEKKYKGNFKGTKVFIGNSDRDPFIPHSRCEESKSLMEKMGADVTLEVYPGMGHYVSEEEINWIKTHFFL